MSGQVDAEYWGRVLVEIAEERSLDQLLQKLAQRTLEAPLTTIGIIWLIDDKAGSASGASQLEQSHPAQYLYAVAGGLGGTARPDEQPRRFPNELARIPVGVGPIGRIATTRTPVILTDLDKDPGELGAAADWFDTAHIRGFTGAPIMHSDEMLGVVGVFGHTNPPDGALQWNRMFANHIAGAIVISRSFDEIKQLKEQLEQHNAYLREEVVQAKAWGDLIGQSAAMGQIVSQIDLVAPTDASVLILGETGTGKELIAHEIHRRSHRRDKPMVRVNCASIPRDLYESEFFGHVKGAYTGAIRDRAGRFETAEGGTLFLDEIAEVPLELQSKLLRVLQEKCYERVGEDRTRRADVRIIAATNRDLKQEAEAGRFRQDLYYRLSVFPIHIAPLRDRKEDIPLLAQHFVQRAGNDLRCPMARLTHAGIAQLQSYDWPGNVRELQNVIERAVILARGGPLEFGLRLRDVSSTRRSQTRPANAEPEFLTEIELRQRERDNLLAVLEKARWKIRGPDGAAELLGVKATTLLSRIKAMGITRPG